MKSFCVKFTFHSQVSPHCLLPDTICSECLENVDNFYSFIKNCLQNIIVLEAQYDIMESCLKTKRKHEKGCLTDLSPVRYDKNIQTDEDYTDLLLHKENMNFPENNFHTNYLEIEKLNAALLNIENILNGKEPDALMPSNISNIKQEQNASFTLVNYDIESGGESDNETNSKNTGEVVLIPKTITPRNKSRTQTLTKDKILCNTKSTNFEYRANKKYFDDAENDLISEIAQRKHLKRKSDEIILHRTKIFKLDTSNRRKCRQPKKVEYLNNDNSGPNLTFNSLERIYEEMEKNNLGLPSKTVDKLQEYTEEDKFIAVQVRYIFLSSFLYAQYGRRV